MGYLVANLYDNFIVGLGLGLSIWFVAFAAGSVLRLVWHMYCDMNGIKDTSRGGTYHNSRFKEEAEKRGLSIEYDKKIGWSITQPTKALRSLCAREHWNGKLTVHRTWTPKGPKDPKPSSTREYTCPCCGNSVRATKAVNIICADCQEVMQTPA